MRRLLSVFLPLLIVLAAPVCRPAFAQYSDNQALYDRIDRLERGLRTLQMQVARGGGGGAASASAAPSSTGGMPSADRLDALDDQIHQLIGRLEEIEHKGTVNADRMDRMQADIDLRFKEMQAQAAPVAPPAQPESISMPGATAPNANVGNNSASGPGLAPGPQALGTLSNKDLKQAQSPVPLQPPISLAPPPPKDPQAQYDEAYAAIQKGDDAAAEAGFKAFLARSPNHQLAPNAQYWLAEIVYKRGDFKESAGMFLEAYKKAPKSTKAPDMLYKAGASFAKLDPPRKKEACTAYGLLFSQHPDMPEHVRRAATSDKQKLGCP